MPYGLRQVTRPLWATDSPSGLHLHPKVVSGSRIKHKLCRNAIGSLGKHSSLHGGLSAFYRTQIMRTARSHCTLPVLQDSSCKRKSTEAMKQRFQVFNQGGLKCESLPPVSFIRYKTLEKSFLDYLSLSLLHCKMGIRLASQVPVRIHENGRKYADVLNEVWLLLLLIAHDRGDQFCSFWIKSDKHSLIDSYPSSCSLSLFVLLKNMCFFFLIIKMIHGRISTSRKMEETYTSLFPPQTTTRKPGHYP